MRKTNAEIAQLLYNRAKGYTRRDDETRTAFDKRMAATRTLADKYAMRHVMASMQHLYPVADWKKAFDEMRDNLRGSAVPRLDTYLGCTGLHKQVWNMAEACFNRAHDDGRHDPKTPQDGLAGRAFTYALQQRRSLGGSIDMRPDYNWGLTLCSEEDEDAYGLMGVAGQVVKKNDILLSLRLPDTSDYGGETRFFKLPLSWGKQVEKLGVLTIENKIVKRAKFIGMFGDVEGYQVTLYQRGVKPTQFSEIDVYVGKLGDTIKICKSRMYIKSVTRRKVGADVGAELLAAFD